VGETNHHSKIVRTNKEEFKMSILMVTGIEGARNCAAVVAAQLGMEVEIAEGR